MIPLADLKAALRVRHGRDNAYLTGLEAGAVAYVQRGSGKYLGAATERTHYVRGNGTDTLYLPGPVGRDISTGLPLVVSVVERAYPGAEGTILVADEADGWLVRDNRLVRKGGYGWTTGMEYEVAYTQDGELEVPADLRQAVLQLVTLWYEKRLPLTDVGQSGTEIPHGVAAVVGSHRAPRP